MSPIVQALYDQIHDAEKAIEAFQKKCKHPAATVLKKRESHRQAGGPFGDSGWYWYTIDCRCGICNKWWTLKEEE